MNNVIQEQLNMLTKNLDFQVDGKPSKELPNSFSNITFFKTSNTHSLQDVGMYNIIFENYIIQPFEGFDLHTKFNKGIVTPFKYMKGQIIKQTDKMYYLHAVPDIKCFNVCAHCLKKGFYDYLCDDCKKLYKDLKNVTWTGWVPKKSCILNK